MAQSLYRTGAGAAEIDAAARPGGALGRRRAGKHKYLKMSTHKTLNRKHVNIYI